MAVKLGYRNVYRDPMGYPQWKESGLPVASTAMGAAQSMAPSDTSRPLQGWGTLWTLLGVFAGGMALNLTPCVYPLIPITVSYFGGQATRHERGGKMGFLLMHGFCYMLGLALTNSTLGVAAALTGGLMGSLLQNPLLLLAVAAILVLFATSMFGLWELRLPGGLTRAASKSYAGCFGSLFMGLTLGFVAAPCIGPFVLGLLTWVAGMGSVRVGFLVFFTLSLGLGLPLFLLAVFSGQIERLPRSGEWMVWVRRLMGWVMVGMAGYFVRPLLPEAFGIAVVSAIALAAGLHLGWIDGSRGGFKAFPWLKKMVGTAGLVMASLLITTWAVSGPGVAWQPYSDQILADARAQKKPVIIDFYATWCTPCRELDEQTFHDAAVVKQTGNDFVMIKVDLTRGGNPVHERLLRQFEIKGVPTLVLLDEEGTERRDLRVLDYLPADQFLDRLVRLKRANTQ